MSTEIKSGGPAFPTSFSKDYPNELVGGMSLRDYFAAKALAGMLADTNVKLGGDKNRTVATLCYEVADAMIAAREAV